MYCLLGLDIEMIPSMDPSRTTGIACTLHASTALDVVECIHAGCLGTFLEDARAVWLARQADALLALNRRNAYIARYDELEARNPLRAIEWNAVLEGRLRADAAVRQAE